MITVQRLGLGALLLCLTGLLVFLYWPEGRDGAGWVHVAQEAGRKPTLEPIELFLSQAEGEREKVSEMDRGEFRAARFFGVRDKLTSSAIDFLISSPNDNVEFAFRPGAGVLVSTDREQWVNGVPVQVSSRGYDTLEAVLKVDDVEALQLIPAKQSRLYITKDNSIIQSREVELFVLDKRKPRRLPGGFSILDDGAIAVRHALPIRIRVYNDENVLCFDEEVLPGAVIWRAVSLNQHGVRLVNRNGDGQSNVVIEAFSGSMLGGVATQAMTDRSGCLWVDEFADRGMTLEFKSGAFNFESTELQFQGVTVETPQKLHVAQGVMQTHPGMLQIVVNPTINKLLFVDAVSGVPLSGSAFFFRRLEEARGGLPDMPYANLQLEQGFLNIAYGNATGELGPPAHLQYGFYIAGYRPFMLPPDAYPYIKQNGSNCRFELMPIKERRYLQVLDLGVPVDIGDVSIYSEDGGDLLFMGEASASFRYGPLEGTGTSIAVLAHAIGDLGEAFVEGVEGSDFVLNLPDDVGAIRVISNGAPLGALFCKGRDGRVIAPTSNDGEQALFSRLEEGEYLIGPRGLVEQQSVVPSSMSSEATSGSHPVSVRIGETSVVKADPEWRLSESVHGQILVSPGTPMPLLVPVYTLPVALPLNLDSERVIQPNEQGKYVVESGGPVPKALIAVERRTPFHRVRGVFQPGGSYSLDEVMCELAFKGGDNGRFETIDVSFVYQENWGDVETSALLRMVDFRVELTGGATDFPVHKSIKHIRLRRLSDGANATVEMSGDPVERVLIDKVFDLNGFE